MAIRESEAGQCIEGIDAACDSGAHAFEPHTPKRRMRVDWAGIETVFCTGALSLRAIGRCFGVSEGAIRYRARQGGWVRGPVAASAEGVIAAQTMMPETEEAHAESRAADRPDDVPAIVRPVAPAPWALLHDAPDGSEALLDETPSAVEVVAGQRGDIAHARRVVRQLFAALAGLLEREADFAALGTLLEKPDAKGIDRLNEVYQKVIALPSQVEMAKRLADTLRLLVELERKVLCIGEEGALETAARHLGEEAVIGAMGAMEAYARMCEGRDG